MSYDRVAEKLKRGEPIILDGATSTDIQRRGAPMRGDTWSADANLTHPDIVRSVHADYIAAGADVIAANTFATSPLMMSGAGRVDDIAAIDTMAVRLAKEAAQGTDVAVAGSMSTMRPMASGSDRNNLAIGWTEAEARALFRHKARILADAGVDLIMMEMMRDTDYAVYACEAALDTGLPVWIGVSAERSTSGGLQGWGRDDCTFDDIARTLAALKPQVMSIMHTSPNDTSEAMAILKNYWTGPIGVYPESGYFKSPDWVFEDTIMPKDLVTYSLQWQREGASLFGGCCGLGAQHIHALTEEFVR